MSKAIGDAHGAERRSWALFGIWSHTDRSSGEIAANKDHMSEDCTSCENTATIWDVSTETRGGGKQGWNWWRKRRRKHDRALAKALERAEANKMNGKDEMGAEGEQGEAEPLPTGLANQANTCYLNSLLQTIYHAPEFKNIVMEAVEDGSCNDRETACALARIMKDLDTRAK